MRAGYRGDWPGRLWGGVPGACAVRVERFAVPMRVERSWRVGFASDLHFGPTTPLGVLDAAQRELARAALDLLVLGGDFVFLDASPRRLAALKTWVEGVPARHKVAVLGNHDLWTWHERIEEVLRAAGVEVLVNRHVRLDELVVAGVDEPWTGAPDGEAAFAGVDPAEPILAVAHSPDGFPHVVGRGADLLVCGHTHGGQVALPGGRAIVMPSVEGARFPHGRHVAEGLEIFVSRGLGGVEVPVRTFAPPDVAVIELVVG